MDAAPEVGGDGDGFRPMELLLVGLAGCTGIDVVSILKKMREDVTSYEIEIVGDRQDEHPKKYTKITVEHVFRGHGLNPRNVERAVRLSATKYCAASANLAAGAQVVHTFRVEEVTEVSGSPAKIGRRALLPLPDPEDAEPAEDEEGRT